VETAHERNLLVREKGTTRKLTMCKGIVLVQEVEGA